MKNIFFTIFFTLVIFVGCKQEKESSMEKEEISPSEKLYRKGLEKFHSQNYAEALYFYNQALELDPNNPDLYYSKGYTKYYLGDYSDAILDYTKAIDLDETTAGLRMYGDRALAKYAQHDYIGTISDLDVAMRVVKDDYYYFYIRAKSKLVIGDKNGACADFRKSGELGNEEAYGWVRQYCN